MAFVNTHFDDITSPSTGQPLKSHEGLLLPGDPEFSHTGQNGSIMIGGVEVAMTFQCCHCGCHWIPVKGSKKVRGFCKSCGDRHCGAPACWTCVPFEKQMEAIEARVAQELRECPPGRRI